MRTIARSILLIACMSLLLSCATSVSRPPSPPSATTSRQSHVAYGPWASSWDAYIARAVPYGFGGGVLVTRGAEVVLRGGYGYANRAGDVRATPETVFYIGSLTKQFTAAAIMKLADEKRLSPRDPLSKFLPGVPEDKRSITLHHLMTHTAGLGEGDMYGLPITREQQVARVLESKLRSEPGREHSYSNDGYTILAVVIELVSGSDYERFVNDHLFAPAGMTKTGYVLRSWDRSQIAHGYENGKDIGSPLDRRNRTPVGPTWAIRGAGGMLSTLDDLHKWDMALRGERILTNEAKEQLFGKHVEIDDEGAYYGYGWVVRDSPTGRVMSHRGSDRIHWASIRRMPEGAVVAWTNQSIEMTSDIEASLRRGFASGAQPENFPPLVRTTASLDGATQFTGNYEMSADAAFDIEETASGLVLEPIGHEALSLMVPSETHVAADPKRDEKVKAFLAAVTADLRAPAASEPGRKPPLSTLMARALAPQTKDLGALISVDVIGTMKPAIDAQPVTYVRMLFERGTHGVELLWEGEKIDSGSLGTSNPARTILVRRSATELAGFNFRSGQAVHVRVAGTAGAAAESIVVQTSNGVVTARRRGSGSTP